MKKRILIIGAVLLVLIIGITAVVLGIKSNEPQEALETKLFFCNETESSIVAEEREIRYSSKYGIPEQVIEALRTGPQNKKNKPIMSPDVTVRTMQVENGIMTVDFSGAFLTEDQTKNLLAAYAVVKSLCQVEGIRFVKVLVEGEMITAPNGDQIDFLSDRDINLEGDVETSEAQDVVVYFVDPERKLLVKEQRTVKITDKNPIEQYIVAELIKGPQTPTLGAVLTADSELISVETKEGTCFVNFKESFVAKNTGTEEKEQLALYAIVNSLTELKNVQNVQFLIDGKKVDQFGTIPFSGFFYRNEAFIAKPELEDGNV